LGAATVEHKNQAASGDLVDPILGTSETGDFI
jgi:hypothetical protein